MVSLQTLRNSIDFEFSSANGKVLKVEKWTTNTTHTSSYTSGVGNRVYTNTNVSTSSQVHTRLYIDTWNIVLEDYDFPIIEGNEVDVLYVTARNQTKVAAVINRTTGAWVKMFSFAWLVDNVFKLGRVQWVPAIVWGSFTSIFTILEIIAVLGKDQMALAIFLGLLLGITGFAFLFYFFRSLGRAVFYRDTMVVPASYKPAEAAYDGTVEDFINLVIENE